MFLIYDKIFFKNITLRYFLNFIKKININVSEKLQEILKEIFLLCVPFGNLICYLKKS